MMSFQGHPWAGGWSAKKWLFQWGQGAHGASGGMGGSLVVGTTETRADGICWDGVAGVGRVGFCLPWLVQ